MAAVARDGFRQVGRRLREQVGATINWCGRQVWLVDGTTCSMPDTPNLFRYLAPKPSPKPLLSREARAGMDTYLFVWQRVAHAPARHSRPMTAFATHDRQTLGRIHQRAALPHASQHPRGEERPSKRP